MKSRLLKSWLRIVMLWWLGVTVFWAMSDLRIASTWQRLTGHTVSVNALNSGLLALDILRRWSLPVILLTLASATLGVGVVWFVCRISASGRQRRVRADDRGSRWQGVSLSMGLLPKPAWADVPISGVDIEAEGALSHRLHAMSEAQRAVFGEVLGLLAAHPDAFVGDGHQGSLLEHTLHVLERLPAACDDPLLPIAAAAHDAGKILAWQRDKKGQWQRKGWHDDLGGLLLSALPSVERLPENESRILILTLRFAHKRQRTPVMPMWTDTERLRKIQDAITDADHTATAVEKKQVLETLDKDTLLMRAFIEALPTMQFQVPGLRKGVQATGWRKGERVYLSEPRLRESVSEAMQKIDANAAAAWSVPRKKGQLAQQTADLIDVLTDKGWIISKIDAWEATPPLWIVQSGTITLRGILIVDLPAEHQTRLPADAPYEMTVTGPLFTTGKVKPKPKTASRVPLGLAVPASTRKTNTLDDDTPPARIGPNIKVGTQDSPPPAKQDAGTPKPPPDTLPPVVKPPPSKPEGTSPTDASSALRARLKRRGKS